MKANIIIKNIYPVLMCLFLGFFFLLSLLATLYLSPFIIFSTSVILTTLPFSLSFILLELGYVTWIWPIQENSVQS